MAQYGDHHITVRTRGGQDVTFDSEYGMVKLEIGDGPFAREVVWLDEHEIAAVAAWLVGWARATAERREGDRALKIVGERDGDCAGSEMPDRRDA